MIRHIDDGVDLCSLTDVVLILNGWRQHDLLAVAESMQSEIASVRALLQSQEVSKASQSATTRDEGALLADTSAFGTELLQSVTTQLDAIKHQLRSELYQARYVRLTIALLFSRSGNELP